MVENLRGVPPDVLGSEFLARALADSSAVVLGVLKLAEFGGRGELGVMFVRDPGLGEGRVQPTRVRPGVLGSANPPTLTYIDYQADVRVPQSLQE